MFVDCVDYIFYVGFVFWFVWVGSFKFVVIMGCKLYVKFIEFRFIMFWVGYKSFEVV